MQHYRLLRNNKESGPYTLKELADLPLKAYDLVWVDGKSAAWRYPSELPEFKEIAPATEEDIYQLFHQKPTKPALEAELTTVGKSPVPSEIVTNKKFVSVILPEKPGLLPVKKTQPVLKAIDPVKNIIPVTEEMDQPLASSTVSEPVKIADSRKTSSIDSIRVPATPKIRFNWKPSYSMGIGVLALIVVIGLGIRSFSNKGDLTSSETSTVPAPVTMPILQTNQVEEAEPDFQPLPSNPGLELAALKRHLSVAPAAINVGMFGGINRLSITVSNKHNQPISSIEIAVDFLEENQQLDHTETIKIDRIEAQSQLTVPVPANGNGRAIQTRIISIGK